MFEFLKKDVLEENSKLKARIRELERDMGRTDKGPECFYRKH